MANAQLNLTTLVVGGASFAATLAGSASAQTVLRVTDDWVTLRPPGGGFQILMPPDWKQNAPRTPNGKLSFIAKQPAPSGRPGFTNCNVVVRVIPEIANYTQATIDGEVFNAPAPAEVADPIMSALLNPSMRENRVVRASNQLAWFMSYSGSYESLNAKVYAVSGMVMLMRPGRTYAVTCAASDITPQQGEAAWKAWQPILMLILGTFATEDS